MFLPRIFCLFAPFARQTIMLLQIDQELNNPASISSVTFSNDGKLMAVSLEGRVYLLDALEGHVQARFDNGLSLTAGPALEASFSPDSRYLISGKARRVHLQSSRSCSRETLQMAPELFLWLGSPQTPGRQGTYVCVPCSSA